MGYHTLTDFLFCGVTTTLKTFYLYTRGGQLYVFTFQVSKTYGGFARTTRFGGRISTTLFTGLIHFLFFGLGLGTLRFSFNFFRQLFGFVMVITGRVSVVLFTTISFVGVHLRFENMFGVGSVKRSILGRLYCNLTRFYKRGLLTLALGVFTNGCY